MDLLLEIGTEELPARLVRPVLDQLRESGEKMLRENRIGFQKLAVYSTPRRLVLYVWEVAGSQADLVEEVKGPPRKTAFDADGKPTRAALGFAKSQGVEVGDLVVQATPVGEYVFARKRVTGRPAREVLGEQIPALITGLSFPRPMRWGDRELKFIRPIHWILCLLGEDVVGFELDGIRSGRITYGLRIFSEGAITIRRPEEYFEKLKEASVLVDQEERKALIWEMAQKTAARVGGLVQPDEDLLEEVTNLVEYPTPLCGSFDSRFLRLPVEVIITPMKEHQRYFPVWGRQGKLLPRFIAFANGPVANKKLVTEGNEKVLRARLQDAEFFYEEDLKTPLEAKVEKLKRIVFLEGLGTIYEKVERLVKLSEYLGEALKLTANQRAIANRAAFLAKADLVTNMVYEFPELQGIMGDAYARASNEKKEVAQAIREHYQPRFAGDEVPRSKPGAVVALADKIDNLVGCFALGLEPTGSQDPYALRRQALGICHITLAHKFDFSLTDLIAQAYKNFGDAEFKAGLPEVEANLAEFFRARLRNLFLDQGYSYDVIEAALGPTHDRIALVHERLEALVALKDTPEFESLLTVYTRAANLARSAGDTAVDPALFVEDEERNLYKAWMKIKREVLRYLGKKDFKNALVAGAGLVETIDRFFNGVMVMVEEPALRNNRLAMLKDIAVTLGRCGDLGKIIKAG
ncbi:MAG TPA: glycine--tRNA ligase subunit beta [Syntrophomonadaceae bacterium]|nr:glycine--tRNA ligase subunit beta [Syntrophomonadaceae bacterium]